jgi:uncharacterized membrane protein YeaQ/YmgE (transglycosylase-associated protein family)
MDVANMIISLISGIIGGNVAGAAMPADKNLGAIGNSVAGFFGGGIGNYVLQALGALATAGAAAATGAPAQAHGLDLATILANIGGSGVGGAILTIIAGLIKGALQKT